MRLLNTKTLVLEEFFDSQIPKYAILSHRWGEREVTYKEMRRGKAPKGPGLTKIKKFCALAAERGFKWAWIDTCCIDKRSSAELSEAINSMYRWYGRCTESYNYLTDVEYSRPDLDIMRENRHSKDDPFHNSQKLSNRFCESTWFTRGWTLQELLAPLQHGYVGRIRSIFFDANWNEIGNVDQLEKQVSQATGIKPEFLVNPRKASVAQKMSWASRRQTSRGEDMAYCLLGLFNVNMPLLYGEGAKKAFFRLQQEIMKISDDESLFAWTRPQAASLLHPYTAFLASEPSCFAEAVNVVRGPSESRRPPYWVTNQGLRFEIPEKTLKYLEGDLTARDFILYLDCCLEGDNRPLGIQMLGERVAWFRDPCKKLRIDTYTFECLRADLEFTCVIYVS